MTESFPVLDVPIFVAVIVYSSQAAAICTSSVRGFADRKGIAPGQRANVTAAYVASVPICLFLLTTSMPVPCCRMQSVHSWNVARRPWLTLPPHFLCKLDLRL